MSGSASLDLRYPIGGLFAVLGIILAGYGVATRSDTQLYVKSGNLNINLVWGVVMLAFGVLFIALAMAASRRGAGGTSRLATDDPEGRDTEARERELGLER